MKWLYLAALANALVHEIDSAYWQEWTAFGLPGDIQTFVAAHLLFVPPLLGSILSRASANPPAGRRSLTAPT